MVLVAAGAYITATSAQLYVARCSNFFRYLSQRLRDFSVPNLHINSMHETRSIRGIELILGATFPDWACGCSLVLVVLVGVGKCKA